MHLPFPTLFFLFCMEVIGSKDCVNHSSSFFAHVKKTRAETAVVQVGSVMDVLVFLSLVRVLILHCRG